MSTGGGVLAELADVLDRRRRAADLADWTGLPAERVAAVLGGMSDRQAAAVAGLVTAAADSSYDEGYQEGYQDGVQECGDVLDTDSDGLDQARPGDEDLTDSEEPDPCLVPDHSGQHECAREARHTGQHLAGRDGVVVAVWPQYRSDPAARARQVLTRYQSGAGGPHAERARWAAPLADALRGVLPGDTDRRTATLRATARRELARYGASTGAGAMWAARLGHVLTALLDARDGAR
ncbi:MAG TPA: hypothetical protein VFX70_14905 [Mycobacteriales bacterium]|nr:hypothetical protein [Mycobacteriales bacterium]